MLTWWLHDPLLGFSPSHHATLSLTHSNQAGNKIIVFTGRPIESTKTSTVMVLTGENKSPRETRNVFYWPNSYNETITLNMFSDIHLVML